MSDEILVERNGRIATVVFNRPHVRNAFKIEALIATKRLGEIANERAKEASPGNRGLVVLD